MATLPAQVQRDLDRANALLVPPQPEVPPPDPVTPEARATQVELPAAQPVAQPTPPQVPEETWEQRFKSLQGVRNSERPRFIARIEELEATVQQLQSRPAPPPPQEQPPQANQQDADVFGQDLVDMVRRTADSMAGNTIRTLEGRIAQLEQQLAGASAVASKTADEVFYERLAQLVPDWETINQDEGFLVWLAEVDPLFGAPRQSALTQAGNARDVTRVAAVFKAWKGIAPEQPKPAPRQEPQVSPRSSGNGSMPQVPAGKPVVTIQAVEAFYKDVQLGRYRGREGEMAAQEAVINAALAENRIVDARQMPRTM